MSRGAAPRGPGQEACRHDRPCPHKKSIPCRDAFGQGKSSKPAALETSAGAPAPPLRVGALAQMGKALLALAQEARQLILKGLGRPAATTRRLAGSWRRVVHLADGKTDLAIFDVDDLDLHDIVFLEVVLDIVNVVVSNLRDVHQTSLPLTQLDERAEVGDAGDPPLQNAANFNGHAETNSSSIELPRGRPRTPLLYVLRIFVSINGSALHRGREGASSMTITGVSPGFTRPSSSRATRSIYASLL